MHPPYYFVPETDNNLEVTIKRREGHVTNGFNPQYVYFMEDRDAPPGVNFGFDRDLNMFHCLRAGIEQEAVNLATFNMERRHRDEIRELKAKHKAALARKPKISKSELKWFADTVKKAIKYQDTLVEAIRRFSEIRQECERNHVKWTDEATEVLAKQHKAEDELAITLNGLKSMLPMLDKALEPVKKEKKCTSKK